VVNTGITLGAMAYACDTMTTGHIDLFVTFIR